MKENVAIDLGKKMSYVVVEKDGRIVKEGYTPTTEEGFNSYFESLINPTVVMESSCTLERAVSLLKGHNCEIKAVHPMKLRIIAESMKKTDKNDAHIMLELNKVGYLPTSYIPNRNIRRRRNLCRTRDFLVKHRSAVKCRIRDQMYRFGIEMKRFNKKSLKKLGKVSPIFDALVNELTALNVQIYGLEKAIAVEVESDRNAKLIDTIPGIGKYGALVIASEIGDVKRFLSEDNIFSYAGLVPRIYQSGMKEWKGHIIDGNKFLKWILVECVLKHINICPDSRITTSFIEIRKRTGQKKAAIAAARRLLRLIYYMLKRDMDYGSYEEGRTVC